jgi:hypothetical protein
MSEDTTQAAAKKTREPKKNSIPTEAVERMTQGLPGYEKASFVVIGHKNGVRIALPKTNGVSRAYFYGNGDYALVPAHDAITVFSEEERKAQHRGGIMAEVNFEKGIEAAASALEALVEAVRKAPTPPEKGASKPKEPKEPKAPRKAKEKPAVAADEGPTGVPPAEETEA